MKINNKTMYNKELIISYNNYYLNSYMKRNFLVISLISLAFIIYMLVIKQWLYAAVLVGILAVYFVLTHFMQKVTTKRILKRSPLVENPVLQSYVFMDNEFQVIVSQSYTVLYSVVNKVKKGKDFYVLHSNDRKTFIVSFAGFDNEDDRLTLEKFFVEKFGMKVKAKKK